MTKLWQDGSTVLKTPAFTDIVRFNEAIDQALCESIASYTAATKKQNHLFESMLSSYTDLCYTLNLKGEFIYINQAMTELYQKESHDILGTTIYHAAMPAAVDIHAHIQSIIDTGERCYGNVEFKTPSGQVCFLEYVYAPIFDKNGQIEAVAAIEHDITINKKTEDKFKGLLEAAPDCLVICDQSGQITMANKLAEKLFGYTRDELYAKKIECLMPSRYLTKHEVHRQGYFKNAQVRSMGLGLELYAQHKDGHEFPVEINLSPLETADGLLALAIIRDLSDRKKMDETIAMMSTLMQVSDEAIIGKNLQGNIFSWSKGAEMLYGYSAADIIGKSISCLFPKDRLDEFESILHKIAHGKVIRSMETLRVRNDGKTIPVSITVLPIKNTQGSVIGASITAHDITEQKLVEEKLKHLAEYDALTGLMNRTLFQAHLISAIKLAERRKNYMAVCYIDIDNFKQINDAYGHAAGDVLLCAASKRMQKCIRHSDTLARIGGDEFVLILLEINEENDAVKMAKKIINQFSKEFLIEDKKLMITVSIGISLYPKHGDQSLLEKADAAMYYVKNNGKNGLKLFDDTVELG